jgi:hypothetical protein
MLKKAGPSRRQPERWLNGRPKTGEIGRKRVSPFAVAL